MLKTPQRVSEICTEMKVRERVTQLTQSRSELNGFPRMVILALAQMLPDAVNALIDGLKEGPGHPLALHALCDLLKVLMQALVHA